MKSQEKIYKEIYFLKESLKDFFKKRGDKFGTKEFCCGGISSISEKMNFTHH